MKRRTFLKMVGIATGAVAAPGIVRSGILMPLPKKILTPYSELEILHSNFTISGLHDETHVAVFDEATHELLWSAKVPKGGDGTVHAYIPSDGYRDVIVNARRPGDQFLQVPLGISNHIEPTMVHVVPQIDEAFYGVYNEES